MVYLVCSWDTALYFSIFFLRAITFDINKELLNSCHFWLHNKTCNEHPLVNSPVNGHPLYFSWMSIYAWQWLLLADSSTNGNLFRFPRCLLIRELTVFTNLVCSNHTEEYWPLVVFEQTSLHPVLTARTLSQYTSVPSHLTSKWLIS